MVSLRLALALPVAAGFVGMSVSLALGSHAVTANDAIGSIPVATETAVVAVATTPYVAPTEPVRLVIPTINVNATIQRVGLSWRNNGDMGVPTNFTDVGWYNNGPFPGALGNAVIDGHLDGKYVPEAVFFRLGDLQLGDIVEVIDSSGVLRKFKVTSSELYEFNASTEDIFAGNTATAQLRLITCAGDWDDSSHSYNKRIVVTAALVGN